ncbi:hypothetical protein AAT19DRAFT_16473 [Rhodotorula toruloides]|uniref:Uncharacterized protein n=1 Tax=Rhodotorula toruloides TaxID=5286 RepID=A0A2T0A3F9_RHOTO|nr:hypothetical protein AAT19DRAFT_16473 [Rhodotorula toruloides]
MLSRFSFSFTHTHIPTSSLSSAPDPSPRRALRLTSSSTDMSAFAPAIRQLAAASRRRVATSLPAGRRQASTTVPHHFDAPHYSFKVRSLRPVSTSSRLTVLSRPQEKLTRFVPTESYPLIAFVACMSTYAIYSGFHAIGAVPGELRLAPSHLKQEKRVEPWEDPRALAGKW